jgi:predicted transcriptional regulator
MHTVQKHKGSKPVNTARGLQKVTELENKFLKIIDEEPSREIVKQQLNKREYNQFMSFIRNKIKSFKEGEEQERDLFLNQTSGFLPEDARNILWEHNHNNIVLVISSMMHKNDMMPTASQIADQLHLSRKTIHKHLKEYKDENFYKEYMEGFRFMKARILARLFNYAGRGDTKAARLFLEATGGLSNSQPSSIRNQQNNLIQINGATITREQFMLLPPEDQTKLQTIISTVQQKITIEDATES